MYKACLKKISSTALILTTLVFSPDCLNQTQASPIENDNQLNKIQEIITPLLKNYPVPSFTVGVMEGENIVIEEGFGFANVEDNTTATADTVYQIGSISKQFAAVSILQLVEAGKIKLSDPLLTFFPDYPAQAKKVTLRHLLSHTSGIVSFTAIDKTWMNTTFRQEHSEQEVINLFKNVPLEFLPGSNYHYSNSNTFLLGLIVAKVSGESYSEYLKKNIFEPLKMKASLYCDNYKIIKNRAKGYSVKNRELVNANYLSMSVPGAAGGICSTTSDLLKWIYGLHHGALINDKSYQQMIEPTVLTDGSIINYGFSIATPTTNNINRIGHTGLIKGFIAISWYYPEQDISIVVLSNTDIPIPKANVAEIQIAVAELFINSSTPTFLDLPITTKQINQYQGTYDFSGHNEKIITKDNRLYFRGMELAYQGDGLFVWKEHPLNQFKFTIEQNNSKQLLYTQAGVPQWRAQRILIGE